MTLSSGSTRRKLLLMVAVALALRLAVIPLLLPDQLDPARDHWRFGYEEGRVARAIAQGKGFANPLFAATGPTAWLPPVYPYLVAGVFKIFGIYTKTSAIVILVLNALTSALTCVPIFLFAREGFGEWTAVWSGWAWAFLPYAIYFPEDRIWDTWLATLLLCVIFLIVLRLARSSRPLLWVSYGLLWGLAGLTNPSLLSVLPVLGVWVCYRRHKASLRWFVPNVATALVFFLTVLPWFARNYRVFHQFVPFRDCLGLELHVGNNGDTSHWFPRMAGPWHNDTEWKEFVERGELNYMAEKKQQALTYIGNHPAWFVWVSLRRMLYLWTGFWSLDKRYLANENMDPYNIPFCTALSVLTLLGLWRAFRGRGAEVATPYLLVLLIFPLIYYVTTPEDWYRRPIDPFFVVLTVYAISSRLRSGAQQSGDVAASPM